MYLRNLREAVAVALTDTPVVLVNGARQGGKSTLVRQIASAGAHRYLTLDDPAVREQATADPVGFAERPGSGPLILDEVQRVPDLFVAIKLIVDRDRQPGRFLLTGSANYLVLPRIAESLAGRIDIQTLWPLSHGELEGLREGFIDAVFGANPPEMEPARLGRENLLSLALAGGYPEAISRTTSARRKAWFSSYVATILQREIREIANVEGLASFPTLLKLLATRTGSLLNLSDVSRSLGMPRSTLQRYVDILQAMFIVQLVPPWSANLGARLVHSPKVFLSDTGLVAHLLDADPRRLVNAPEMAGPLLENFVVAELFKQRGWSNERPDVYFFRTHGGLEVDIVLEGSGGRLVAIEVKASASPRRRDVRGLEYLRDALGDRFVRGVLLYTGQEVLPFGERIWAMPVESLWRLGAVPQEAA